MDSDEEERLRQWKQHLAAQQAHSSDDEPPNLPPSVAARPRGSSRGGDGGGGGGGVRFDTPGSSSRSPSARGGEGGSVEGAKDPMWDQAESIDWASALMPQLRMMKEENEALQARLKAQEKEVRRLKIEQQAYAEIPSANDSYQGGGGGDLKEGKIVELAKKNRVLSVALDKERAKAGRLMADVQRLQAQVESGKERDLSGMDARSLPLNALKDKKEGTKKQQLAFGQPVKEEEEEEEQTPEMKVKELSGKVSSLTAQVSSQRVANERLKQEASKLKDVLRRELGDVPLDKALEDGGGWTGRAQALSLLHSKVAQLKRDLAAALSQPRGGPSSPGGSTLHGIQPPSPGIDASSRIDDKHRKEIEKIEKDRRREAEVLQEELVREKQDKIELKKKADANGSRVKNLEKDCKELRDKIQVFLSKSDNDDTLIAALQAEMQSMASKMREERKRDRATESGAAKEVEELRAECKDREQQVERQHKIIVSLRAELQAAVMRGGDAGADGAEVEQARAAAAQAHQRVRVLEVGSSKMTELTELLKAKLAEAEEKLHGAHVALRQEKQRSVELERRAEQKSSSNGAANSSQRRVNSAPGAYPPEKVQQLVDRLNSTTEEIEALQESFKRTLEVKEEELRTTREMLREQQAAFDEGQRMVQQHLAENHNRRRRQ